jgi:hypothetical protein
MTLTLGGKVLLEPSRERTVTLKEESRKAESMVGPRLPVAPMRMTFLISDMLEKLKEVLGSTGRGSSVEGVVSG